MNALRKFSIQFLVFQRGFSKTRLTEFELLFWPRKYMKTEKPNYVYHVRLGATICK